MGSNKSDQRGSPQKPKQQYSSYFRLGQLMNFNITIILSTVFPYRSVSTKHTKNNLMVPRSHAVLLTAVPLT